MAVYVVTGKLGAGKTLVAVGKIQDKIVSGCKVATNLDLRIHKLPRVGIFAKTPNVVRIPDKPSLDDLLSIGKGNDSYDENKTACSYSMNAGHGSILVLGLIKNAGSY